LKIGEIFCRKAKDITSDTMKLFDFVSTGIGNTFQYLQ
jgi:hypothetical protein